MYTAWVLLALAFLLIYQHRLSKDSYSDTLNCSDNFQYDEVRKGYLNESSLAYEGATIAET